MKSSITVLIAALFMFTGCGESDPHAGHDHGEGGHDASAISGGPSAYPYKITTTVGMITDIVSKVAGDKAEVTGIMKEGVDPHLYKPTVSDIGRIREADVVFYNGLMLEGKMSDVLNDRANRKGNVFRVTSTIDSNEFVMEDEAQHYDPHIWMDVQGWIMAVKSVATDLSEYDKTNADSYKENADNYIAELEALDTYVKKVIGSIPEKQRVLVTAHDAFQYFGRAYDIEVRGIQGISTESEAGLKDINDLVDYLVENKIPAVFVETSVDDKYVRSIVEGAQQRGHNVKIGGSLFSDAMGAPGTYEGTYMGMIDSNATLIARALGGEAPERGMNGKLNIE